MDVTQKSKLPNAVAMIRVFVRESALSIWMLPAKAESESAAIHTAKWPYFAAF